MTVAELKVGDTVWTIRKLGNHDHYSHSLRINSIHPQGEIGTEDYKLIINNSWCGYNDETITVNSGMGTEIYELDVLKHFAKYIKVLEEDIHMEEFFLAESVKDLNKKREGYSETIRSYQMLLNKNNIVIIKP